MNKFIFYNTFNTPFLVVDENKEVIFANNAFKRVFFDFKTLKKFSHKLNYDCCPLNAENIEDFLPLYQAITSKENFSALVNYQSTNGKLYFNMNALKRHKNTIIGFTDTTAQVALDILINQNTELEKRCKKIYSEHQALLQTSQNTQAQAIKMTLVNKVSNIIRESIDISTILKSALYEINTMFGSFKTYYAKFDEDKFIVKEACGADKKEIVGKTIKFDRNINKQILDKKTSSSRCLKEYVDAEPFKMSMYRIILPIFHTNKILGVLVLLNKQNKNFSQEIEILENISAQLGNAIVQASLFKQINEQKDELQNTLKELKETQLQLINSEKMASLGQLIAGVAHEINTPLASIKSNNSINTKLIKKIVDENLKNIFSETNEIDKVAIERINKIVVSLKKFVRLDEEDLQEADINKEIDLTLELMRHETKNRIEIERNYGEIPEIKCYPNMLNQVFMNILINACHAIKNSGKITITTTYEDNNLIVKIKDTGTGIKEENINKIFTAGFTTKGVGVGTGLGLAISTKIIQKHKGTINVTSKLGKGCEFTIKIPVNDEKFS